MRLGNGLGTLMQPRTDVRDLAQQLGLKTGDQIARPKSKTVLITEAVQQIKRSRRTTFEKQAEDELEICVVALIGHANRVIRRPGDNEGGQAIATAMSSDPRHVYMPQEEIERTGGLAAASDHEEAFEEHRKIEFTRIYVALKPRAVLFKTALDSALMGSTENARYRWRDIPVEFDMEHLPLFFGAAASDSGVLVFDAEERDRRRNARVRQLERRARGR